MLIEPRGERVRHVAVDDAVGVQEQEMAASRGASRAIHPGGKSGIGGHADELNPWESLQKPLACGRIAEVIYDDHFQIACEEALERVEAAGELRVRLVVDYQDRNKDRLSSEHVLNPLKVYRRK